jgi:hypothetical protein
LWRASGWLARLVLRLRSAAVAGTAAEADLMVEVEAAAFTGGPVAEDFTEAVAARAAMDHLEAMVAGGAGDRLEADAAADRLADREVGHLEDRAEEREVDRLARGAEAAAWVRHRTRGDLAAVRAAGILAGVLADQRDRTLR